ncbi:MAG: F0F1 ATP synthase subunit A [Hymenobacteraceae bacterium]|nr:F0F1 ATP synthase subunit A [Hymenobacteraceae bacterium]MDX5395489.1 F0F1 ATP synthase subunit A [Hymenobacteraceae bacterium]MDX5444287.1 F0F1 ATP synthase subunit A [Hymenobacteraceae bacterium]MDX5511541.1 F0F1 ATP synthase subunit A [Hymenobacteraceae bacterium]
MKKLLVLLFAVLSFSVKASAPAEGGGFKPGDMIMHHIADDYSWHFADGAVLNLPVILYGENGVDVFSSSNFYDEHHNLQPYKGYVMEHGHIYYANEAGEPRVISEEGGKAVYASPLDFSITKNVASLFLSAILLLVIFFVIAGRYKSNPGKAPRGIQSFFEPIIIFIRDEIAKANIGPKYERYMPYLLTIFFFIWFNNLLGLMPGGANLTGNIAVTMVLAVMTLLITVFSGNKSYWGHIFNTPGVPWWLKWGIPIMPIVEVIGIFTKPFSLMVRLFANITAGHIIILSLFSLIFIFESIAVGPLSVAFATFMNFLELFVALLQAYIFTLLSAMYFGGAVEEHEHEHDHAHEAHH